MISKELWWVYRSLSFCAYVMASFLTTYYIYVLITNKPTKSQDADDTAISAPNDQNKTTYRGSVCGICCYTIASVSAVLVYIAWCVYFALTGEPRKPLFITLWIAFGIVFYNCGIWFMLLTFLLRIDHAFKTFNHASLPYPNRLIKCLYVHCILIGILMALLSITLATSDQVALAVAALTLSFTMIAYDVILLYLLFSKLFRLFVIRGTAMDDVNIKTGAQVIELDTLQTTTRYSSLILMGVISTVVFTAVLAVEQPLTVLYGFDLPGGVLMAADILVNATSLFLMFAVNRDRYEKYCSKYHSCLLWCCIACAYGRGTAKKQSKEEYANLILNINDTVTF